MHVQLLYMQQKLIFFLSLQRQQDDTLSWMLPSNLKGVMLLLKQDVAGKLKMVVQVYIDLLKIYLHCPQTTLRLTLSRLIGTNPSPFRLVVLEIQLTVSIKIVVQLHQKVLLNINTFLKLFNLSTCNIYLRLSLNISVSKMQQHFPCRIYFYFI